MGQFLVRIRDSDRDIHPEFCLAWGGGKNALFVEVFLPGPGIVNQDYQPAPSKMALSHPDQKEGQVCNSQEDLGLDTQPFSLREMESRAVRATEEKEVPGKGGSS
jgi:hypothetical protein